MIRIDPAVCVFAALLLLILPLNWLLAAVCAAAFHELCHVLVLCCQGNRIQHLTIGMGGAKLQTDFSDNRQELFCALAGPMGSLFLLVFFRHLPRLALCGAVQGLFNLLPLYPMDGGRILACALEKWCPGRKEKVTAWVEGLTCALLFLPAAAGSVFLSQGLFPIALWFLLICRRFPRKIPCKRRQIRVQ